MKTGTKLAIGFAGVVVLVWIAAIFTGNIYANMQRQFQALEGDIIPSIMTMNQIEIEAGASSHAATDYVVTGAAQSRQASLSATNDLSELSRQYLEGKTRTGAEEAKAAELAGKIATFNAAIAELIQQKDQRASDFTLTAGENEKVSTALSDLLASVGGHKTALIEEMTEMEEAVHKAEISGMWHLLIFALLDTLIATAVAFFLARSIIRPMEALRRGTEIIGRGNLDYKVGTNNRDEIGQLSRAFDRMTRDLKATTTSIDNLNKEIAERKRIEEALRQSEEKFSKTFHSSPDIITIATIRDGQFIEVNDSFTQATGYTREEVVGRTSTDLGVWVNPEDRQRMTETLMRQGGIRNEEFEFHTKSGEIRTYLFSAEIINIGSEMCLIAVQTDITDRKQAEKELLLKNALFTAMAETTLDGILVVDEKGKILLYNRRFQEIGNIPAEWLEARDDARVLPHFASTMQDPEAFIEKVRYLYEHKEEKSQDEISHKDGRVFDRYSSPLVDAGGIYHGRIWFFRDITERKQTVETLKASEEKYRAIFEQAADSIVVIDEEDAKIVDFNDKAHENLGYSRDEFAKVQTDEINATRSAEKVRQNIEEIHKKGMLVFEEKQLTKSGELRDVRISSKSINIGGRWLQMGIWRDITEQKHAEKKLRESEEKFRNLFEHAKDTVLLADAQTGIIVDVNPAGCSLLGLPKEKIIGRHQSELHPPEMVEAYKQLFRDHVEKGAAITEDVVIQRADGTKVPVDISASVIELAGKRIIQGVFRNITERKQAEEALRDSEEFSTGLLENAPNPVSVIDPDTSIKYVNPSFEKLTGFTTAEVIGRKAPYPWWPEESRARFSTLLIKDMAKGGNRMEKLLQKKSGEHFWAVMRLAPVKHGDKIGYFLVNWVDITERKAAEEKLKQALANLERSNTQMAAINKELEAFSYSVSHDLRAPLRTIDGFSQALLEDYQDNLDKKGQDYLQRMRAASQRMGTLIDDLLKLSRLSRSEMHQEPVDLSALAGEIAAELKQANKKRDVEFVISPGLTAEGDRQLLKIAMENLLGNAWKFTGKRKQAKIEVGISENGGRKAYFVKDNGAGFDMKYADKLFGAFQRLHDTTDFPGIGIGLATVQRIIHRHGGTIWAEGAVGKGATFYFTIN